MNPITPAPPTAPPVAVPTSNIANILSSLVKAGIVSASTSAPSQPAPTQDQPSQPVVQEDPEKDAIRSYRESVLALPVKLNSNDILRSASHHSSVVDHSWIYFRRQRPAIVDLLYNRLSVQCKQCGLRFADNTAGKKSMESHLDMHFRQNRKANQNVGRGHSRGLFVTIEVCVLIFIG